MSDPTPALTYATPGASTGSPVAAGVWIMLGGLVLIFFGGCFCIGILMLIGNNFAGGSTQSERDHLSWLLYAIALACFAVGGWVMFLGLRKLLSVGR